MKSPLFYQPEISKEISFLSPNESKHVARVLRLKKGDSIRITDGKGKIYDVLLTSPSSKKTYFDIVDYAFYPKPNYSIHIALALTKNIQRVEWFIEKAVEVGIDEFTFTTCSTSERKIAGMERLVKKAVSAMKQSKKAWMPIFNPLIPFQEILHPSESCKFIAHINAPSHQALYHIANPASDYFVMVGPEGGFTQEEITVAEKENFQSITLGSHRLRTETAGLMACHTLHLVNQQIKNSSIVYS